MFGLLTIDKPAGVTSRRIVDRVQRLVRPAKAGHAGTLDPLATGVLVVAVGSATRLISYVQQHAKRYQAEFLLGRFSPTEDTDGEVSELPDAPVPSLADVELAAAALRGEILQRPPAFSALKVAGRRAYALARAGEQVELATRPITVHELDVFEYDYPRLRLDIRCSSGTYVRSLGRDLVEGLGTAAVMSGLRRTEIGPFTLERSIKPAELTAENFGSLLQDPLLAVAHLPRIALSESELLRVVHGRTIDHPHAGDLPQVAALDGNGRLAAILMPVAGGALRAALCFSRPG